MTNVVFCGVGDLFSFLGEIQTNDNIKWEEGQLRENLLMY